MYKHLFYAFYSYLFSNPEVIKGKPRILNLAAICINKKSQKGVCPV
jgi:hypothetical protein